MILSPLLFKERLTAVKVVSFLAVVVGIFLVNGKVVGENGNVWGLFCGLMSAVMYAFMVICNKTATDITGLENSMLQHGIFKPRYVRRCLVAYHHKRVHDRRHQSAKQTPDVAVFPDDFSVHKKDSHDNREKAYHLNRGQPLLEQKRRKDHHDHRAAVIGERS